MQRGFPCDRLSMLTLVSHRPFPFSGPTPAHMEDFFFNFAPVLWWYIPHFLYISWLLHLYLQGPDNIWPSFIFWHISPTSFCFQIIRIPWQLTHCWKSVVCTHFQCFSQIENFGNFNILTIENISSHLKLQIALWCNGYNHGLLLGYFHSDKT